MKKIKTKYTLRSDGRICLSQVIDGKRKYFYGASDREVEQKRDDYIASLRGPGHVSHNFRFFADSWWEQKEPALSPTSVANFRKAYERCLEAFGDIPIADITPQQIYSFLARFAAQGYSAKVMGIARTVIRQVYDRAFIASEVDRNPVNDLPPIKCKASVPREAAEDDEIAALEAHKRDSLMAAMHYFMLYTGVRRGEAVALQQKHIDGAVAHIVQSAAYTSQKPIIKQPKTAAGIRDVELLDNVLEILPHYQDPETYIFFPEGLPNMRALERGMKQFQTSIGMHSTAHQLRHSFASMLHSAGVDVKDAQALLGHSSVDVTQNIYTHIEKKHKASVLAGLNEYVKSNRLG